MKRVFLAIALTLGVMGANAQNVEQPETEVVTFQADTYPQEMSGDDYNGLTKKLTFDRMIPPYGMEVTLTRRYTSFSRPQSAMWIWVLPI